jgi:hypothetical protein
MVERNLAAPSYRKLDRKALFLFHEYKQKTERQRYASRNKHRND